jgi:hypothetical protein
MFRNHQSNHTNQSSIGFEQLPYGSAAGLVQCSCCFLEPCFARQKSTTVANATPTTQPMAVIFTLVEGM